MKVLIADGSPLIRGRLVDLLHEQKGVAVAGQAGSAAEAVSESWRSKFDAVIMDIHLPGGNGFEAMHRIKQHHPETRIIVITEFTGGIYRQKCMAAGADYILDKATQFYEIASVLQGMVKPASAAAQNQCSNPGKALKNTEVGVRRVGKAGYDSFNFYAGDIS